MSLIHLRNVGVVSPRPLFHNLDLTIHETDRIGLIAGNGGGKTTLLRCLARQAEPGSGEITHRRGLRVGFVEQDVPANLLDLTMNEAIRRALPAAERETLSWKIGLVLDMLETPGGDAAAETVRTQRRLATAGVDRAGLGHRSGRFVARRADQSSRRPAPRDAGELDHSATEGVAMVIASHDRQFLDDCTNRTLFLRPEESRHYAHPFSRARGLAGGDDAAREARLARDAKEADRLRRSAGHLRNVGINSGSDVWLKKSKQLGAPRRGDRAVIAPAGADP